MHFWLVKESIIPVSKRIGIGWNWEILLWTLVSTALSLVCFTEYFIPSSSTHAERVFGWGYRAYIGIALGLYVLLIVDAARTLRKLDGSQRTELQVWLLGGCSVAASVIAFMALRSVTGDSRYGGLQPVMILIFYVGTVLAITTYKIFDARQIVLVVFQKFSLVVSVAGVGFFCYESLSLFLPESLAFFGTTAVALSAASALNSWLDRLFHFYPRENVARQTILAAAQRESRIERLEPAFCEILKGWGQCDRVIIASGIGDALTGNGVELPESGAVSRAIRQLRWATPERLVRERSTDDRAALAKFLHEMQLGVLVVMDGPSLTTLVGVGVAASRRPYTYPQVTQLMELASIMESALERAHFSAKAQHSEQLATVGLLGANLAHEIRNPLVAIKTFVHLLPTHHQDPVFREKFFRLIGDEVTRIDQLTEQLLDLASRHHYTAVPLNLHPVLLSSLELVKAKAGDKQVRVLTEFQAAPDAVFTDAGAAKQVILNLCFNAIQAVEARSADDRWIKVATRNTPGGVEVTVSDGGPGITAEVRPRLFQPFQTTKSTGFGLGLAICRDILANVQASINVDPPVPGQGATFRVTYPCQPSSS